MYIVTKTPALPFIGIWVSATGNGQHVPPMQSDGGVPPPQGYAAYREICRITFKLTITPLLISGEGYNLSMTTAYTWVSSPEHKYEDHPEGPDRLTELRERLSNFKIDRLDAMPATRDEIARVHSPRMIEWKPPARRVGESLTTPRHL